MKIGKRSLFCACAALLFAAPLSAAETHTNSIGMEFVKIPAGSYLRGTPLNCAPNFDNDCEVTDEMPQKELSISSFWLGKYEVTQEQWVAVMGSNPSLYKGRQNPVDAVSWEDAQQFIEKLNAKEGHNRYRLPTEAEWEYAARAGSTGDYCFGDDPAQLGDYAWYHGSIREEAKRIAAEIDAERAREDSMIAVVETDKRERSREHRPVGQKSPNAWGLHDMHGNVAEWVQDWYDKGYYAQADSKNPQGPKEPDASASERRVLRGCYWQSNPEDCRVGKRVGYPPRSKGPGMNGFRVALSLEQ